MNATLAANVANANPGSQILVQWVGGSTGDSDVCPQLFCPFYECLVVLTVASQCWAYYALHDAM
jgi:hypothetical protein